MPGRIPCKLLVVEIELVLVDSNIKHRPYRGNTPFALHEAAVVYGLEQGGLALLVFGLPDSGTAAFETIGGIRFVWNLARLNGFT